MTYVGAYGRDERLPVERLLRRENHPLGVRRDEATKIATAEAEEAASANRKWTFGAAAGALLVAGTFAAGALGISGGATPVAGSAPEHAPASPGNNPSGPVVGAPAPGKDDSKDADKQQQREPRSEQTSPSSAAGGPQVDAPSAPETGADQSGSTQGSGTAGGERVQTPAPAPVQPAPQQSAPAPAPAPAPEEQQQSGDLGDVLTPVTDTVGDVLTPVTDVVGGVLSPLTGSSTTSTQSAPAPSGPALTMINPLGDLLGG